MNKKAFFRHKTTLVFLVIFFGNYIFSYAQSSDNSRFISELKQIQDQYKASGFLKFDVRYLYADESAPDVFLDSLKGEVYINGSNYKMALDNTETIRNDLYTINLFTEDKLILLSNTRAEDVNYNPLVILDSVFQKIKNLQLNIQVENGLKVLNVSFPEGGPYKSFTMVVDTASGYLSKMIYVVKTEALLDDQPDDPGGSGSGKYAIVETIYNNYQNGIFDSSVFDENNYVTREGDQFKAGKNYKDYKIFLATPKL